MVNETNEERMARVVVLGSQGVGKTGMCDHFNQIYNVLYKIYFRYKKENNLFFENLKQQKIYDINI